MRGMGTIAFQVRRKEELLAKFIAGPCGTAMARFQFCGSGPTALPLFLLQVAGPKQNQDNQYDHAYATDRTKAPLLAMRPNGEATHKRHENKYRKNCHQKHFCPSFFNRAGLGRLFRAAVKLHRSNRKQLCERVNSQCYAQRNIGERQDRRNEGELTA